MATFVIDPNRNHGYPCIPELPDLPDEVRMTPPYPEFMFRVDPEGVINHGYPYLLPLLAHTYPNAPDEFRFTKPYPEFMMLVDNYEMPTRYVNAIQTDSNGEIEFQAAIDLKEKFNEGYPTIYPLTASMKVEKFSFKFLGMNVTDMYYMGKRITEEYFMKFAPLFAGRIFLRESYRDLQTKRETGDTSDVEIVMRVSDSS